MPPDAFPLLIFAAGFGTRMGQLTAKTPKSLIPVAGKPLIDHALEVSRAAKVPNVVVNLHYLGEQLERHLRNQPVNFSWERPDILETGGGLRAALPLLGRGPVMVLNSDAVWTGENPLAELAKAWDATRMDALLLLTPVENALGHGPKGDFVFDDERRISRGSGRENHVYLGASIIRPDLLAECPETVFSLNVPWNSAIRRRRAYGVLHRGGWCDVGSPEGIALAERLLAGDAVG